jgi:hypothetical protein
VELGEVIHIEDVNPDQLQGNAGHVRSALPSQVSGEAQAFDPTSIVIAGSVLVSFKFRER